MTTELKAYTDAQLAWFLSLRDAIPMLDDAKLRTLAELFEVGIPGWKNVARDALDLEVYEYKEECNISWDELHEEIRGTISTEEEKNQCQT